MNEAEKIRKQLERYETSPVQTEESEPVKQSGDIWGRTSELPDDWKPEPRYVKEEPDYSIGFKIGDWYVDPRGEKIAGPRRRQAIPHPNYDAPPGTLITSELE